MPHCRLLRACVAAWALVTGTNVAAATMTPGFSETTIVSGLIGPTSFAFVPDGRILITEKGGAIRIVKNGALLPVAAVTLAVSSDSERGLLGLTRDPAFSSNGFVYIYYTTSAGSFQPAGHAYVSPKNRVARLTFAGDTVVPGSEIVLVDDIPSDTGNHNGGHLQFGSDGTLYISTGDGGDPATAQNLSSAGGKILRINVSGQLVPDRNPYRNSGDPTNLIWSQGLRNPWRFTFDPADRLFIGDVGSTLFEEISIGPKVSSFLMSGRDTNFGWPLREGIVGDGNQTYQDPIYAYPHGSGASISLGVFAGTGVYPPGIAGGLFFGDFVQGFIKVLQYAPGPDDSSPNSGSVTVAHLGDVGGGPVHFASGPDGRMFYLAFLDGELRRIDYTLSVLTTAVTGTGTVTSAPAGIACGTDCHEAFTAGLVVTLSAAPAPGFTFAGWSGHDDCRDGVVTLLTNRSCTAWFVAAAVRRSAEIDPDGDGRGDLALYRPSRGLWSWQSSATQFNAGRDMPLGAPADIPAPADYDGDGRMDMAFFSPDAARWQIADRPAVFFGRLGDIPVPADYNGDGRADIAVYRPGTGTWHVKDQFERQFGTALDIPVPAHYGGGPAVDLAVFRRSTGEWFVGDRPPLQFGRSGDLPVPADYNGDGATDVAVYRRSSGTWFLNGYAPVQHGSGADLPVPSDVDGDGRAELVTFRRASATWSIRSLSSGEISTVQHGMVGDWPLALRRTNLLPGADFDGDRRADIAVFRPSTGAWYPARSSSGFSSYQSVAFGAAGDIPVPGDYDGDGVADVGVYRPSTGMWYLGFSSSGFATYSAVRWGLADDIPAPGDFDGDGRTDVGVFRPATGVWYLGLSTHRFETYLSPQLGMNGDRPVPGDYDGDGRTDIAVFRASTGIWHVSSSTNGFTTNQAFTWGTASDIPAPGDYDGDGRTDIAVFRPATGVWYAGFSSTNFDTYLSLMWGAAGDIPVPSDFDGDGRTDLAVYRPATGVWYPGFSSTDFTAYVSPQWGVAGDIPVLKQP